jgi:DNA-binding LacI/PurR family transcriptional regulator
VWAELLNLTVITHPIKELGSKIAKMIINGIKDKTELINHEIIEPFILERGSVNSKNNK